MAEELGLTAETEKLTGLWLQAQHAGWYLPHQNICWVSERHNVLRCDDRGRIHSLSGPAIAYPDGWAIYAVHGVLVPEDVIKSPKSVTVKRIESEQNSEIRRVMMGVYGESRFLLDSGAQEVGRDMCGTLYRKEIAGDEPLMMVRVLNSTPEPDGSFKPYFLRVPPTVRSAEEAVAWTFGKESKQYSPLHES